MLGCETIAEFNERFGQGQTTRQGIGWNQNNSVPVSKMLNKQQRGKLIGWNQNKSVILKNVEQTATWQTNRQEADDKRIVILMKYHMQNGFLNWG